MTSDSCLSWGQHQWSGIGGSARIWGDPWLRRLMAEKPPKLVVAPVNKMARIIWALSVKKETYRAPAAVAAAAE